MIVYVKGVWGRLAFVSVVVALLLAGCGSGQHPPTANQPTPVTTQTASTVLKHMPQGSALLTWTPSNQTLNMDVRLYGLAPNSMHPAHIPAGSCQSQGAVVYPLNVVTADASGNATVTTTIPHVKTIPASGWYVNVPQSTDMSTQTGFDPIVCGNVQITS
jgi:hypothetical protein